MSDLDLSASTGPRTVPTHVAEPGGVVSSTDPNAVLATPAIGATLAIALVEPGVVAGIAHFVLPDSGIDPARAREEPGLFADTAFRELWDRIHPAVREASAVRLYLVGGADAECSTGAKNHVALGARNVTAAELAVASARLGLYAERVGGACSRRIVIEVGTGAARIAESPKPLGGPPCT